MQSNKNAALTLSERHLNRLLKLNYGSDPFMKKKKKA